ncbi:MAG: PEP-CTERM sorting domain-containing protein [Coleofasciculaceae cyanobacterium SM2_3_26]|nr:PEP-CTERM sorting domain-containing protein [Coleofasciculaceae cyanobacterium SM2_3_26]
MANTHLTKTITGTVAMTIAALAIAAPQAQAITWNYAWDSFYDGTGSFIRNGQNYNGNGVAANNPAHGVGIYSQYEHFGMAYAEDIESDRVVFAFNSNLALGGWDSSQAKDGNIAWGDLFINLDPTKSFAEVQGTDSLLAIRFDGTNDSGVDTKANNGLKLAGKNQYTGETGVYSGVTAKNSTANNGGWSNYNDYNNYVQGKTIYENGKKLKDANGKDLKGQVELVDGMTVTQAQNYLGTHGSGVIGSYQEKIGDITMFNASALAAMGLDFAGTAGLGSTLGTQTFGFSVSRSLFPENSMDWLAHVMAECANDTIGMLGVLGSVEDYNEEDVPEPAALAGFVAVGLAIAGSKRRKAANR